MTTALEVVTDATPAALLAVEQMTAERKSLIKRTVAPDATDAELNLFIYDCLRRRSHPLDRMIHFTKRGGRYTPITGIDYMRSLAAETGEHAGTDDGEFVESNPYPKSVKVTVYRLTQGQRYAYAATARWDEYYPGDGGPGFMWRKMPHVMLSKVAEALALRKAFPRELGGLYERVELDQAGSGAEVIEVPPTALPEPKTCLRCGAAALPGGNLCATDQKLADDRKADDDARRAGLDGERPPVKPPASTVAERSGEGAARAAKAAPAAVSGSVTENPPAPESVAAAHGWEKPMTQVAARKRAFALMEKYGIQSDAAHRPDRLAVYGKALKLGRLATDAEAKAFTASQWMTVGDYLRDTNEPPLEEAPPMGDQ